MSGFHRMTPEQRERFEKMLPLRAIVAQNDGHLEGLIEHSFSMDWSSTQILLLWSGEAHSNIGTTHILNAVTDAEDLLNSQCCHGKEARIIDPLDPDCPIDVDFEFWMRAKRKFNFRNPPFKMMVPGSSERLGARAEVSAAR